jgi:Helicase HerA, central domain/Type IV secretion-system coupling protein DNA-binding domain
MLKPVELDWLALHWPRELPAEIALSVLRQIAADRRIGVVVLEVEVTDSSARYRLGVRTGSADRLIALFQAFVPAMAITPGAVREPVDEVWKLRLSTKQRALRSDDPLAITRGLLAGLSTTRADERLLWQWVLGSRRSPVPVPANSQLEAEQRAALQTKRRDHGIAAVARLGVAAESPQRRKALIESALAGLKATETPGLRVGLRRDRPANLARPNWPLFFWPLVVNTVELLGLTGWPLGGEPLPGVPRSGARWLRADPRLHRDNRVIAKATAPGDEHGLGISVPDARHHLHLLGPTGVGKSTLLANLAVADMKAGLGVVVVDPKGDLVTELLERVPPGRQSDVVVLDPIDSERPVGLNPLATGDRNPELVADQVLSVFHSLWESSWGPRTADILHASLLSLAGRTETTLCALPILLTNYQVRRQLLARIDDPIALGPFWAWYENLRDTERQQVIAPIMNKLRAFLLRRRVRGVLGQVEPRFQVEHVFSKHKILLVSLGKGLLGPEASALLGSLVVAQVWNAALAQAAIPSERRQTVSLYIDEFQDYLRLPTDLADALAQARGLGVAMTLAHQHLAQLPTEMRAAVLANARSRVCFQMTAEDARVMARRSNGQLKDDDFQQLGRYEVYVQLVADGEVTGYASGKTLPPAPITGNAVRLREISRQRYGRPIAEVEAEINRIIDLAPPTEEHPGRRARRRP